MYAKLVTYANTVNANTFYYGLMNVITGAITTASGLDPTYFNIAASNVVTTTPTGWTIWDSAPSANIIANCQPKVIAAPISDVPGQYKYLWMGQVSSTTTNPCVQFIPTEGWANSTHVAGNNTFGYIPTVTNANSVFNMSPCQIGNANTGMVTIVSASNNHLFVWTSSNLTGTFGGMIFCSEFTRDDPWNTTSNPINLPNWFLDGIATGQGGTAMVPTTGSTQAVLSSSSVATIIPRWYDPNTKTQYTPYYQTGSGTNNGRYSISTRFGPYIPSSGTVTLPFGGGLGFGTSIGNYFTVSNPTYTNDSANNFSYPMSELRVIPQLTSAAGVPMSAYGSISTKSPFIYAIASPSNWVSLDEFSFSGSNWTLCRMGTGGGYVAVKQA